MLKEDAAAATLEAAAVDALLAATAACAAHERDVFARVANALAHPLRVRIVAMAIAQPSISASRVAERSPFSVATVAYHLKFLVDTGLLVRVGDPYRRGHPGQLTLAPELRPTTTNTPADVAPHRTARSSATGKGGTSAPPHSTTRQSPGRRPPTIGAASLAPRSTRSTREAQTKE